MPLIWIAGAYFGGLIAADLYSGSLLMWNAGLGAASILLLVWKVFTQNRANKRLEHVPLTLFFVCGVAFFAAGFRFQRSLPDLSDPQYIAFYAD